ncbi:MAG: MoaD/ThiS family protein [Vulcanimicrobiaceae bacterium]
MKLELFGMARALIGAPSVELAPPQPATLRGLLGQLAARYPQLVGSVLEAETHAPIEPNLVLLDGRRPAGLDEALSEADLPCLLFLPSGG